jgi:hypothetical protein
MPFDSVPLSIVPEAAKAARQQPDVDPEGAGPGAGDGLPGVAGGQGGERVQAGADQEDDVPGQLVGPAGGLAPGCRAGQACSGGCLWGGPQGGRVFGGRGAGRWVGAGPRGAGA